MDKVLIKQGKNKFIDQNSRVSLKKQIQQIRIKIKKSKIYECKK